MRPLSTSLWASICTCPNVLYLLVRCIAGARCCQGHASSAVRSMQGMEGRKSPRQLQPISWLFRKLSGRAEDTRLRYTVLLIPS